MGFPCTLTIPDDLLNDAIKKKKVSLDSDEIRKYLITLMKRDVYETFEEKEEK